MRGGWGKKVSPAMTLATAITARVNIHAAANGSTVRRGSVVVVVLVCCRHRVWPIMMIMM